MFVEELLLSRVASDERKERTIKDNLNIAFSLQVLLAAGPGFSVKV